MVLLLICITETLKTSIVIIIDAFFIMQEEGKCTTNYNVQISLIRELISSYPDKLYNF